MEFVYSEKKQGRLQLIHQQSTSGRQMHWLEMTALQQVQNQPVLQLLYVVAKAAWELQPARLFPAFLAYLPKESVQ